MIALTRPPLPPDVLLQRMGENVRSRRRALGLTQAALADLVEVSVAYVSLIEHGRRNPSVTTVVAIAQALGVPVRELLNA